MSANYASDDLINFLLASALYCGSQLGYRSSEPSFDWNRGDGRLETLTPGNVKATGQMLRDENLKSIMPRREGEDWTTETLEFKTERLKPVGQLRPPEILKAADYYEYQSSRHTGWWESDAREFIECLRKAAWMNLPEYRRARWGEPNHVRSYYRATPEPAGREETGTEHDRRGLRTVGPEFPERMRE